MKILNVGSLNIDYVYQVAHFVQPGETIASLELNKGCGGKGLNQSVALARAGARTAHAGCVGRDGLFLLQQLEAEGVDISGVRVTDAVSATPSSRWTPPGRTPSCCIPAPTTP